VFVAAECLQKCIGVGTKIHIFNQAAQVEILLMLTETFCFLLCALCGF
jgi:hypothetical protein